MTSAQFSRREEASPIFEWKNPAQIIDGDYTCMSWADYAPTSQRYLPFNTTELTNDTGADLTLYPNQNESSSINLPNGSSKIIDRKTLPSIRSWKIKAVGANAAANKLKISNYREAVSADSLITRIFRKIFGGI